MSINLQWGLVNRTGLVTDIDENGFFNIVGLIRVGHKKMLYFRKKLPTLQPGYENPVNV